MSPSNTRAGFVGGLLSTTDTGTWISPLLTPLGTAAELLPSRPQAAVEAARKGTEGGATLPAA